MKISNAHFLIGKRFERDMNGTREDDMESTS
jgi:hypothetical protein